MTRVLCAATAIRLPSPPQFFPSLSLTAPSHPMGSNAQPLHILFFPYLASGHMIPMVDMAKLFAHHGVKVTILTTPANAPLIQPTITHANDSTHLASPITLTLIPFPSAAAGLPDGCENISSLPSLDFMPNFHRAVLMFRQPFDEILTELHPDCVVTDMFLPWTVDVASDHALPRLVFHGTCAFALCARHALDRHSTLESLPPDAESVVLSDLPHRIEMLKSQFPDHQKSNPRFIELFNQIRASEERSYGVVFNSFNELEPDYVKHYRNVVGRKSWHIGPVSLTNKDEADKSGRGNKASIDPQTCLKWLDSKNPGSVVYVCFGSIVHFTATQLKELALGLEASASNCSFIWVVRKGGRDCLPQGYEDRIEGRGLGLIIEGWAPQILILNHPAVGGFFTHCGWNSSLEAVSSGVPMITWPMHGDQFFNERLIVEVLGIGVAVGVDKCTILSEDRIVVEAAQIERAVGELMGSREEAEGRRRRARELGEMAKRAADEGGSSYVDMENLIEELVERRNAILSETSPI